MAGGGEFDDVTIRVNLDVTKAEQATKKMDAGFSKMGKELGKKLSSFIGGGLTAVAAGMAAPALGDMFTIGKGVTGVLGRQFSRTLGLDATAGKFTADQNAQQRTIEAFGLAGAGAKPEQVEGVMRAYQRIERLRDSSRRAVEKVTDPMIGDVGEKMVSAEEKLIAALDKLSNIFSAKVPSFRN